MDTHGSGALVGELCEHFDLNPSQPVAWRRESGARVQFCHVCWTIERVEAFDVSELEPDREGQSHFRLNSFVFTLEKEVIILMSLRGFGRGE